MKKAKKQTKRAISSPQSTQNKKEKLLWFLAKFFGIYFALTILIELADLSFLTQAIAKIAGDALGMAVSGSIVQINGHTYTISNSCTGLASASILAAVIFSLKKPELVKKVMLFIAGTLILLLANIPRVMLVLVAAKAGFDANMVHTLTWFLMSAIILLIWYYGTKKMGKVKDFSELL
ncbi:MAG: archaeosortase/exosortase family protein [archaeon]|mgnify:CR=1 FL=1